METMKYGIYGVSTPLIRQPNGTDDTILINATTNSPSFLHSASMQPLKTSNDNNINVVGTY